MRGFIQEGDNLRFIAPTGGVISGKPVLIGALLVIPVVTAAETESFDGCAKGVVSYTKTTAQAWTEGQRIHWNIATSKFDSDGSTGPLVGVATEIRANPTTTGEVRLNGTAPSGSEGQQPLIAAIVDNGGGAAADGTIAIVTAPTALTDNGAGTADGTVAAMADIATAGGATPTAAQVDTAVNAVLLNIRNNFKEFTASQTANRLAIIALTDAVKEITTKQNEILAALKVAGIIASA